MLELTFNLAKTPFGLTSLNSQSTIHTYEVRPRKDQRGVDLISDVLPFGRLWYAEPDAVSNAVDLCKRVRWNTSVRHYGKISSISVRQHYGPIFCAIEKIPLSVCVGLRDFLHRFAHIDPILTY
jgi:hypothetical protein